MANKIISSKFYVDSLVQTLSGDIVNIEQDIGTLSGNIENIQQDIIDLSGNIPSIIGLATETFVTSAISSHNTNIVAHSDIRDSVTNVSNSLSSYAPVSSTWKNSDYINNNFTWSSDGNDITITQYIGPSGTSIIIPDIIDGLPVTRIGANAFTRIVDDNYVPSFITSIDASNIEHIDSMCFWNEPLLETINLPALKTAFDICFEGCINLKTAYVGKVENIDSAFYSCSALTGVFYDGDAPSYYGTYGFSPNVTSFVTNPTAQGWGDIFADRPVVRLPIYSSEINVPSGYILSGHASETFVTSSISSHNNSIIAHDDIRTLITTSTSGLSTKVDILNGYSISQDLSSALIQDKLSFTPITGLTSIAQGDLVYNADEHTLSFGVEDGSLELGKEVVDCYTNLAGVTLLDGDVVSIKGVSGNRQAVGLTDITNSLIGNACIGVVTRGNTVNNLVRVTKIGKVHGLNTNAYTEGDELYVDAAHPGKLTATPPSAPNTFISVGIVEVKHTVNGVISVNIRISPRLEDLSDVDGIALTVDGQFPSWHNTSGYFDFDKNINDYKQYSGFENRTDSHFLAVYTEILDQYDIIIAPTDVSYNIWTNGTGKHTIDSSQIVTLTADQTISYIYIDNTGTLQISTEPWDLSSGENAPCAIVFKDGSNITLTDERHSFERNRSWHKWAHFNIGAMYHGGLTGIFTSTALSVTQGQIYDEDIAFDTQSTQTTTSLWYRNATSGMRMTRNSVAAKGLVGGVLAYDNGSGTLQPITNNRYATNWVYATNDPAEPIYTVISQGDYTNITNARNAASPTINLSTAEWKLIYRVIYQRTSGTPTGVFIEAADFRTVQTGVPTAAVSTDHAALINRDAASSHPATAISYDTTTVDAQLTKLITQTKSFVVTNPSLSATYSIWRAPYDLTITGIHGFQTGGTNLVGMLTECDSNGLNPVKINSTDMTLLTSNVSLSSFDNPIVDAGDYIGWINTGISGDVLKFIVSFEYVRS